MDFTRTYHRTSYPAISPTDTKNSQAGRTVLITGSTGGIGFATARAFLAAGADTVVVTGRNGDRLRASVKELESVGVVEEKQQGLAEDPSDHGSRGRVVGLPLDISEPSSVMALWTDLANQNIAVDTLVLNAATLSSTADRDRPPAVSEIWRKFQVNVLSSLQMTEHFLSQQSPISSSSRPRQRLLVNLTTARAHANPQSVHDGYGPSKVAITKAFEALADHTPTADLRVHNVNPGIIRTEASLRFGMDQDWMFDDVSLPSSFIVWLCSPAAAFLHGRLVWANWDVEELMERREEFENDPGLLRIGLNGVTNVDPRTLMARLKELSPVIG